MRSRLGAEWGIGGYLEGSRGGEQEGESEGKGGRVNVSGSEADAISRERSEQSKQVFHPHTARRGGVAELRAEEERGEGKSGTVVGDEEEPR